MSADFDWIFFDCFNTLIDDFDPQGDESGLGSLPAIAVQQGFFPTPESFVATYRTVRATTRTSGKELLFSDRVKDTLRQSPKSPGESEVSAATKIMEEVWLGEYRGTLRLTPGAVETVAHWAQHKPLAVISNFFWPGLPARYLEEFGLAAHFRFIVDSAAFGLKKPHPAIFHHALALAGLKPAQAGRVLMIGDRLDLDIHTAADLGFQVLHLNRRETRPGVSETPAGIPRIYNWDSFRAKT